MPGSKLQAQRGCGLEKRTRAGLSGIRIPAGPGTPAWPSTPLWTRGHLRPQERGGLREKALAEQTQRGTRRRPGPGSGLIKVQDRGSQAEASQGRSLLWVQAGSAIAPHPGGAGFLSLWGMLSMCSVGNPPSVRRSEGALSPPALEQSRVPCC